MTYRLNSVGSMDVGIVVHIDVVKTLRRSESQVVGAWGGGLSETSHGGAGHASGLLYFKMRHRIPE